MPRLGTIEPAESPSDPEIPWDPKVFRSPNGSFPFVLYDGVEFRMCAEAWKARLEHAGRDITPEHPELLRFGNGNAFSFVGSTEPWSHDSTSLVVTAWDLMSKVWSKAAVYTVTTKTLRAIALPSPAQWPVTASPTMSRFLIGQDNGCVLYDFTPREVRRIPWQCAPGNQVIWRWLTRSNHFLGVGPSNGGTTVIRFFDGTTGDERASIPLDPNELLPYDGNAYREVDRERFTLISQPGTHVIGRYLDVWSEARFDPSSQVLLLKTYRPTGPARREVWPPPVSAKPKLYSPDTPVGCLWTVVDLFTRWADPPPPASPTGQTVCEVRGQWVAVEIIDE